MLTQGWGDFIAWLEGHQASAEVFVAIAALVVTAVLVCVTISYVRAARRQADASMEMARQMREQAEASHRLARAAEASLLAEFEPRIIFHHKAMTRDVRRILPPRAISVELVNEGSGPAYDIRCSASHAAFRYEELTVPVILASGERQELTLARKEEDPGLEHSEPSLTVKARYGDARGNHYRSSVVYERCDGDWVPGHQIHERLPRTLVWTNLVGADLKVGPGRS
jgi:hypothetical protein